MRVWLTLGCVAGLVAVAASVPAKTTLPILSNILLEATKDGIVRFLLTAGGIAMLYKRNASISGAEVLAEHLEPGLEPVLQPHAGHGFGADPVPGAVLALDELPHLDDVVLIRHLPRP